MTQMVKNLPAVQEMRVQSLSQEDPMEKGMATHSSVPAWNIPWTEESEELQSMGSQRVGYSWAANTFPFTWEVAGSMENKRDSWDGIKSRLYLSTILLHIYSQI